MMFDPTAVRTLASGLRFPEGPAVSADSSIMVPEIEGAAVSAVRPDGTHTVLAEVGGGANGCAFGPDGALYVCNDGGYVFAEQDGIRFPVGAPEDNQGGCLQRVDVATGAVRDVFTQVDGTRIGGLNDIVFDAAGLCYFVDTTLGKIYYADPVAGSVRVAASGLEMPNGAGLSPDGSRLYVAETFTGRLRVFAVTGPGQLAGQPDLYRHPDASGGMYWDGLAVDGAGNVCVADLKGSGIRVISPQGELLGAFVTPVPDAYVTNLCFGGPSGDTAYIASAGRGLLYEVPWPWPGLRLNFQP
jgi:gluconolactonase